MNHLNFGNLFKIKKYRLIFILLVIVLLLLVLKINLAKKIPVQEIPVSLTPAPSIYPLVSPLVSPFEEKGDPDFQKTLRNQITNEYPLFSYLPYKEGGFTIQKYLDALTLEIIIPTDTPEVRQKVLDWISSKGVDPKTHTLIWKIK